jgi:hypothetical protein
MPSSKPPAETEIPRRSNTTRRTFLRRSFRKIRWFLGRLSDNDDKAVLATADSVLGKATHRG